ncbi:Rbm25 protein [Aspergillus costaricaensis CBS 115574]|uniref:Rbm25 protein n=1 Tax=Aspergillus costaricaensis CBS 115574 TaxID=1448317 RepID=A0ACD1ILR9_9EURO|nr:Rbm25 protein [Aspergillus costaricaensis CBS 115574]RAK91058.1 Rbm25 protein [Aspergillus costaricaensis CBS 115574]
MYNPYQPPGLYGRPPDFGAYPGAPPGMAPPPGMVAPGTTPPPGMQPANAQQPGRPAGFPPNFQPPPNMPNINFSAPVIRLGTSGPKSATPDTSKERGSEAPGRRAGLGSTSLESQRQNVRDAMMQLQPPTREEIVRTLFVGGITEGVGGDEGVEKILRSAGNLRRWIRATDADEKPCKFGFAEYEDPESLGTAVEVLKDVQVPVKRQTPSEGDDKEEREVEKSTLLVVVDESSLTYLEQYEATRGDQDPAERQARLDAARSTLANVLSDLCHPTSPTQKEDVSAIDREGDTAMKDSEGQTDGTGAEVVTIPITVEDELSDIPPEMRETVAKEIAAFRERSNRRDIERLKREEEIESMERARNAGTRFNRLASPPPSAPSGPAAGANGVPLGPRDRSVSTAPSGPKGFGVQIPKDYQKGVSFVNGGSINGATTVHFDREEEETDASDEELERRRQEKKEAELEKQFLDQERRWLNRERSRTAALEREKKRDKEEEAKMQEVREEMDKRYRDWNDDNEAARKVEDYYADRGAWLRSRAGFRAREVSMDEADRAAEERERARSVQQREQARGMADDFLARQAEELETRNQAPREPQRFKLSLGAAAQKAQAATSRRTVAEVEGLLEDEEEPQATARRPLIPIKFDSAAEAAGLSDEERAQAARQLAAEIPTDKEGLWGWEVKWEFVDETVVSEQLKPFVEKKIVEYLGVQEQMLVDVVEEHVRKHGHPQELVEQLEEALDEEAEVLVRKLWRMIIFFSESEKRGLSG